MGEAGRRREKRERPSGEKIEVEDDTWVPQVVVNVEDVI